MPISEFKNLSAGQNADLGLVTADDKKTITLNSRSFTHTADTTVAFRSRANQAATTEKDVIGGEIQPRVAPTVGCGTLIGLKVEPILKGTVASGGVDGTLAGIRGLEVDLTDENVAGRTITGDIVGIRIWQQLAGHTVSGDIVPIKVDAAGGNKAWTHFAKLVDDGQIASSTTVLTAASIEGYLKVRVGTALRYIALYSA